MNTKRLSSYLAASLVAGGALALGPAHASSDTFRYDSVAGQIQRDADARHGRGETTRSTGTTTTRFDEHKSLLQRVQDEEAARAGVAYRSAGRDTVATPGFEPTKSIQQRVREDRSGRAR